MYHGEYSDSRDQVPQALPPPEMYNELEVTMSTKYDKKRSKDNRVRSESSASVTEPLPVVE